MTGTMRGAQWKHKVDVSDVFGPYADLPFEQRRDAVVLKLRQSPATSDGLEGEEFILLLEDLADTPNEDEFDDVWDSIYNLADTGKWLWIETLG